MRPPPVVLIFIKGLGIGGAERLISEAAVYWDRDRFDYRVAYLLPWKDHLVAELKSKGVEVALIGNGRGGMGIGMASLRRHIRACRASLVHAHLPSAGIMARIASPVPVVYTEHNLVDSYRPATRLLNRWTYPRNARTIAVSEAVAASVGHYRGSDVRVIPNGVTIAVSAEEKAMALAELEMPDGAELVVHVGNIRPHKGHETLVAAARWLASRRPNVRIVSIGGEKNPGDLERVKARAEDEGVDGTLRFLGRREDARAFLAASDVVINPSDFEGLPIVLLEAMSLARPIVATAVGGVPGLIENGRTGILVPPGDGAALGSGIEQLLIDRQSARRMGEAGRVEVLARHGLEPMVKAVERLYDEVLAGRTWR